MSITHTEHYLSSDFDNEAAHRQPRVQELAAAHRKVWDSTHALGRTLETLAYLTIAIALLSACFIILGYPAEGLFVGVALEGVALLVSLFFIFHRKDNISSAYKELDEII